MGEGVVGARATIARTISAIEHASTRTFTPRELLRMIELGIVSENEPVELLDGRLVVVSPQGPAHSTATGELRERLARAYGAGYAVREEKPLELATSLPEPDVAVVLGSHRAFAAQHPRAADVVLVVEVAVISLDLDRDKARIYAAAGIAVYWLLDVTARCLELHSLPHPDGRYGAVQVLTESDTVTAPGLDEPWRVGDLLP